MIKHHIQRILKRTDRALTGSIVEFSEQFLYGHREILCSYANLKNTSMIKGSIEHGWALDSGLGIRKFPTGRYLYLSWSSARVARNNINHPNTIAIGAPFIYAHKQLEPVIDEYLKQNIKTKREIIFFPYHGNEYSQQNADSQIQLFSEKYEAQKATVCLYWVEYINPNIYTKYRSAGFEIVCAGFSGQMEHTGLGYSARKLAGSPIGGRPTFLLNTIAYLAAHKKVVMGGLGSITFYAAYMKKDLDFLHKYFRTDYLDMDYKYGTSFDSNPDEVRYRNYVSDYMNCNFEDIDFNSERFRDLAKIELGLKDMRSSKELSQILTPHLTHEANLQSFEYYLEYLGNFQNLLPSLNV